MKHTYRFFQSTLIALAILFTLQTQAQNQTNKRAEWFTNSRFGMFIHWGIYSGIEGIWKGEKLRYNNNYAEWIFYRNNISKDEYVQVLNRFDWENIKPEKWVIQAKNAGMKYIIFTAKHHDGFALWNSKASNYHIGKYTNGKRDIVKELAAACKKHHIKLCLYYSHWIDWEHPMGWSHSKELNPITNKQYDSYWQNKVIPQIKELLTNYGNIAMLWFDMWIPHTKSIISKQQLLQLKNTIRKLQPNCLINSRLGLSIQEDADIDFKTLNDNQLGKQKEDFPWQSPATVAHSWGFSSYEKQWKSTTTLLQNLINNVSLNGNMVLNIGPKGNGDIPFEIAQRLQQIGDWLKINGEAIYGASAYELPRSFNDWGSITCKTLPNGNTRLYLHVYNWNIESILKFSGVTDSPKKVYLLSDSKQQALPFQHQDVVTTIQLPKQAPNPYVSVIVLEYKHYPKYRNDFSTINSSNGYALNTTNCSNTQPNISIEEPKKYGSIPQHIHINKPQLLEWKIYIEKPCHVAVDLSYHVDTSIKSVPVSISCEGKTLKATAKATGQTVGEPNCKWHIPKYVSKRMGLLHFNKKGFYTLRFEASSPKAIDFQWIWLKIK